jgi:hypothetical protein
MKALENPDLTPAQRDLLINLSGNRKVVINVCHGGFGLSDKAEKLYLRFKGTPSQDLDHRYLQRDDPVLIQVIEELGPEDASGRHAELKIVEIPADVDWILEEYDGKEWIAEKHRIWS